MNESCEHSNPLKREGTTQVQRLLDALVPENVKLHELTTEDWLSFAKDYAALVNYYKPSDAQNADGDWDTFFPEKDQIAQTIAQYSEGDIAPHLALFIAFLKLLAYPQASLNGIPKRHLDFYYKDVLKLKPNAFSPDTVHVIFELAKNATTELVKKDSGLEAGKDEEGNTRTYVMENDFVANPAQVVLMHSLYKDNSGLLKYAVQPNTQDGLEEALEEGMSWSAFGDTAWPLAPLEIALTGEIFSLKQGTRNIIVTWEFDRPMVLNGILRASMTTEEGWTEEIGVTVSGAKNNIWELTLSDEELPITAYDEELHLKRLNTALAVLKFKFEDPEMYQVAKELLVTQVDVLVNVVGVTDLIVQNEIGLQLPDKPFMPFGPRPKKNSALTVESKEFIGKNISSYNIAFNWLNLPPNFSQHYTHYENEIQKLKDAEIANRGYLVPYYVYDFQAPKSDEFFFSIIDTTTVQRDDMRENFQFLVSSPYHDGETNFGMFAGLPQVQKNTKGDNLKGGAIKLKLKESFYHDLFNNIYISVVSKSGHQFPKQDGSGELETYVVNPDDLPNEPYTPLVESVTLNYSATASITLNDNSITGDDLQLVHLNPFGSKILTNRVGLLPDFNGNEFFFGLQNARARDTVSILFQVAEGSENPALSTFLPGQEIKWDVLTQNGIWQKLEESDIIKNTTNNFLRSGIVVFSLPKQTTTAHYLLEDGLVWLRATLQKRPAAIARFIGLHAQASTAIFDNNNNVFDHLDAGLPAGEIKQLAQRKSKIKAVHQPYASSGGKNTETDTNFYRRISERLRHKDRAVTIWDYEHLTLQSFPQIYKAKCLNHTKFEQNKVDELCPGHVTLVVVPQVNQANTAFGLYPSVSQNTKDEIKAYLLPKQSLHVNLDVVNPQYELVEFSLFVRFYPAYDYNFYRTQLEQDLIALLAPWAFDSSAEIKFNNALYSYDVINFIENLEYVDFLEDFKMYHLPLGGEWQLKKTITPSTALAVLAPKETHTIAEAEIC